MYRKALCGLISLLCVLSSISSCGGGKCGMSDEELLSAFVKIGSARATDNTAEADKLCTDFKAKNPDGCKTSDGSVNYNETNFKKLCPK